MAYGVPMPRVKRTGKAYEPDQLALDLLQRDEQLTRPELEREIDRLQALIGEDVIRLRKLRGRLSAKLANEKSIATRHADKLATQATVQARWIKMGRGRDAAAKIAKDLNLDERRVRRYVAPLRQSDP
jgi:hypothetical protein